MITDEDVKRTIDRATVFCDAVERLSTALKPAVDDIRFLVDIVNQVMKMGHCIPGPPDKLMEHMTEPELSAHLSRQLKFIKKCQSEDTVGSMLIIFQKDMICQYGATVDPEQAPKALRELADRIERRETVKR